MKDRLKEPSTWAGIGVLLQVAKSMFPTWAPVFDGLTVAAGGAAGVLAEKKV